VFSCHSQQHRFCLNNSPALLKLQAGEKPSRITTRKKLDSSIQMFGAWVFLTITLVNLLPLCYFFLMSSRLHNSNMTILEFYNRINEGGSLVRWNEAAVLNTIVY
jgi:hypothetical protein